LPGRSFPFVTHYAYYILVCLQAVWREYQMKMSGAEAGMPAMASGYDANQGMSAAYGTGVKLRT